MSNGKCPRCGGKSIGGTSGSRCAACLKKLSKQRRTPGHKQRAWKNANDAVRRQDGQTAKAKKKTSGKGSTKALATGLMRAEKKTGQKLSPNRKANSKGYASSNVEYVPKNLNRGRHDIDREKVNNWKSHLKKSLDDHGLDVDYLESLLVAYTAEKPEYEALHKSLSEVFEPGFLKRMLFGEE